MFVNRNAKLLSLVLSIIFIFAVIVPSRASAFDNDSLQVDTCDELSMEELQKMSLSADELPQIIDWSIAEKNGNVYRLYSQEDDLNSAIFQNKDGSKTMYYFGEPIKYTAEDGTIQDKSNRIATSADSSEDNYTYYTPQNDIQTFFPEVLGTGADVFLKAEGFQLSFSPVSQGAFAGTLTTTKGFDSIQYRDVFGKETVLKYTPLFSGLKEEIILQRPAENKIQFLLKTYEMEAVLTDNVISLFSDGTRCVGEISKITIYDSSAIPKVSADSTVTLTATDKKGEYLYTISLDQNFLLREDIEYPVYVDPTVTISSSGYGTSKTILDTPVYSNVPSNCQGANIYNIVGNANALSNNYGVGRTLMKFPGLINHAIFQSISNSQVSSMKLHMYSSSGSVSQSSILVNHYTGSSWNETSTAYNNVSWNGYGLLISSTSIGSGNQWVSFELKNAIPTWQNNVSAADRGVMLRNSNETSTSASKTLCSTESSYKPYVSLTWFGSDPAGISSGNIYRLRNTFSSRYLSASSPTYFQQAISMNTTRGNDLWRFDRVSSGVYRIESLGVRCDSTGLQPSMLTASAGGSTSTSGTLSLTAYSSSNTRQWWYVTKNTQGYSLVSYYYPQLAITVSSATSAPTLSSNANHPKWTMTSASFSNYWSGAYSGGSSPYTINVIVESSAVTGYLTQSVYSCATAWNGIDSNIFIRHYPSTYTGSYASADFTVRVRGVNSYGKRFGRLVPTPNNVNQNWTSAVIEISTESSSTNNSSYTHTDRQMNFLHELGHALKLAHPHESDSSWHPLSIMNQGLPSTRDYIPGRPSGYDKYNLSRKW